MCESFTGCQSGKGSGSRQPFWCSSGQTASRSVHPVLQSSHSSVVTNRQTDTHWGNLLVQAASDAMHCSVQPDNVYYDMTDDYSKRSQGYRVNHAVLVSVTWWQLVKLSADLARMFLLAVFAFVRPDVRNGRNATTDFELTLVTSADFLFVCCVCAAVNIFLLTCIGFVLVRCNLLWLYRYSCSICRYGELGNTEFLQ